MLRQARASSGLIVWVDECQEVERYVVGPNGQEHYIIELLPYWLQQGGGKPVYKPLVPPPAPAKIDHEVVPSMELLVGDILINEGGDFEITGLNKVQGTYYIYVDTKSLVTGKKQPSLRIPKKSDSKIKWREGIKMLALQNAIESTRKLEDALAAMLDIRNLPESSDGKVAVGNSNIRVPQETLLKAARDEVKIAQSKLSEVLKKI